MTPLRTKKLVILGIMSRHPVPGVIWQYVHYLVGFQRLGYEVYYVEDGGHQPSSMLTDHPDEGDRSPDAARFIAEIMRRFGLGDNWAFHALQADGQCYGMSLSQLHELYREAELIINMHGATLPLPEHTATDRLVYLETDPVMLQIELYKNLQETIDFLNVHCAYFTYGENYGHPDCGLPVSPLFEFHPTRQPVIMDFWEPYASGPGCAFTTIGNWQQEWREIEFNGEIYHWSKHYEFLKFLDLPGRTDQPFELALSRYTEDDQQMLEGMGWRVRDALRFNTDIDAYREYIAGSRGEFTVAKDQNIRLRSGWFSDRSVTYLAAGRPVITQDTGFGNIIPEGEGLFAFRTMEEALDAVQAINSNYKRHSRAALGLGYLYFSTDVVLKRLLEDVGVSVHK